MTLADNRSQAIFHDLQDRERACGFVRAPTPLSENLRALRAASERARTTHLGDYEKITALLPTCYPMRSLHNFDTRTDPQLNASRSVPELGRSSTPNSLQTWRSQKHLSMSSSRDFPLPPKSPGALYSPSSLGGSCRAWGIERHWYHTNQLGPAHTQARQVRRVKLERAFDVAAAVDEAAPAPKAPLVLPALLTPKRRLGMHSAQMSSY